MNPRIYGRRESVLSFLSPLLPDSFAFSYPTLFRLDTLLFTLVLLKVILIAHLQHVQFQEVFRKAF
jgi:hypothetical protein